MAVSFSLYESPHGAGALAWRGGTGPGAGRITRIRLPEPDAAGARARLLADLPEAKPGRPTGAVAEALRRIERHLRGELQDFTEAPLALEPLPPFHRRVYEAARTVAAGTTISYGALATLAGSPGASRAVGQAMARNPFPLVVPCHRVLAAGGRLGGFSATGGTDFKRVLLALEGVGAEGGTLFSGTEALPYDGAEAVRHLCAADPTLARLISRVGAFRLRLAPFRSCYEALGEAVIFQQLTGRAARTILGRVKASIGGARFPAPRALLTAGEERLRQAGLSRPKVASLRDLAARAAGGELPSLSELRGWDDEAIVAALDDIRGIGRWTVEMLLLFRLGRPDVLPTTDYGVRKAFALTFGGASPALPAEVAARGERWRPFRSVASWYLWRALELPAPR